MVKLSFECVDEFPESKKTDSYFSDICGVIRNSENSIVGFFDVDDYDTYLLLTQLEILDDYQYLGYGTSFIKALFDYYPNYEEIRGQSSEDAASFYARFDVDWSSTCDDCDVKSCSFHPSTTSKRSTEPCDEYSENLFSLKRSSII